MPPHHMTMTVTGACMLWVGWFGFNAGSALAADGAAGMAMLVTHIGAASGSIDDSLDVFPVHGVGGILGTLLTGIFVSAAFGGVGYPEKVTMGGQVLTQLVGIVAVGVWSGIVTWILLKVAEALAGLRVQADQETEGLDTVLHNEKGYNL